MNLSALLLPKIVIFVLASGDQGEDNLLNDGLSIREEQRQRLLNNSELLENTGNMLNAGYRATIEAEEIGARVLQDLNNQRETIQRARSRVRHSCLFPRVQKFYKF